VATCGLGLPRAASPFPYTTLFRSEFRVSQREGGLRLVRLSAKCGERGACECEGRRGEGRLLPRCRKCRVCEREAASAYVIVHSRSPAPTPELQPRENLVCRLLPQQ